jgi:Putative zinc-finger
MSALRHEECWQLLPWLVNGRLPGGERQQVEEHLRGCEACVHELSVQRLLSATLSAPERVTHAPGPSFRKLLARIDQTPQSAPVSTLPSARRTPPRLWRSSVLTLAASVLMLLAGALLWLGARQWSAPRYNTYTSATPENPGVLHVALDPSLSIAATSILLQSAGARIVEGPDPSGILGVVPSSGGPASAQLHALAARLRGDARVRWVQPLPNTEAAPPQRPPQP